MTAWHQRPEAGGARAVRLMRTIAVALGRPVSRFVLLFVAGFFLVARGPERAASRTFLSRAFGRPATLLDAFRHVYTFASVTLDRVYLMTAGFRKFDVQVEGIEVLQRAVAGGRGALLFGSHLGSFDALRLVGDLRRDVPVRAVIDLAQNPALSETLNALNPEMAASVIDASGDPSTVVIAIGAALQSGALVAMPADRGRPGGATLTADFLGVPAPFPTAPWIAAAALDVPVLLCFGLFRGGRRYELVFERFADTLRAPRAERQASVARSVATFAERLSFHARRAPFNWFNFYDFWNSSGGGARDVARNGDADDRGAGRVRA
jgi:predicted LPLAT superfamily acyltransferase